MGGEGRKGGGKGKGGENPEKLCSPKNALE